MAKVIGRMRESNPDQSFLSAPEAAAIRDAQIARRTKLDLPARDSGNEAFVVIKAGVGTAGSLLPVGTTVYMDKRSGHSHVRNGYMREATDAEKSKAVLLKTLTKADPRMRVLDPADRVPVYMDIPELGVKAGETVETRKMLDFLYSKVAAEERKNGRKRKPRLVMPLDTTQTDKRARRAAVGGKLDEATKTRRARA